VLRDYRAAFLRYLARGEEPARLAGYELGRDALARQVGLLDLVGVHHEVLCEVLRSSSVEEGPAVAAAASEFLIEVLASYDMAQRALPPVAGPTED
jgi:hypothetical protein